MTVKTEYDAFGRAKRVTNPYRPHLSEPQLWTESCYDALDRITKVKTPDNAEVLTGYSGNAVTVTDQAGKKRRTVSNALGHLIRVDESNDAGQLDISGTPVQSTGYAYDALNNLITVTQGSQTRSFVFSSLSRMTSETNPESGTTTYEFDNNGNPTKKTDARTISTNFTYDVLNRVTQKSYSGESGYTTPTVTYTYDEFDHSKGKLTKVSSSVSEARFLSFDEAGRVTSSRQTTDAEDYDFQYSYNLAGMLVEQTYPSGRKVKNVFEGDGDLSMVQSRKNENQGYFNYAKHFSHNSVGAVTSMQLGNSNWQKTVFNSRLQATQIAQGTTNGATNVLKLDFDYGSTQNNGTILSQTITVPTVGGNAGFTAVQNYTYDTLNRIKSATETISSTETWKQTYSFDRFGNRTIDEANTTTLTKSCGISPSFVMCSADRKVENPSVSTSTNRIVQDQDSDETNDYVFDSTGNTTKMANGFTFKFDGENKQYEVRNGSNEIVGQYFYDGSGKRVKKVVPDTAETTIFVYDSTGRMVAEYSTVLSQSPKLRFTTNDHLGSPRIKTDENGAVISRSDYRPYGEDIVSSQRISGLGYSSDDLRQKFTGYERDGETGLDFAQARMYGNTLGRFTTTDPSGKSIDPVSPQTWNRYTYCYNNPLTLVDENGKWPSATHDSLIETSFRGLSTAQISLIKLGSRNTDYFERFKPASTLWPSEAHKHAMTPDGMSPEAARESAWGYLKDQMKEVKGFQKAYEAAGGTGISPLALVALGEATHVYEDMTSPAHGFDKTYKIPQTTVVVSWYGGDFGFQVPDLAQWKKELEEHSEQESGRPTDEQRAQTALYSRAFFLVAFGKEKFNQLEMTDEERKAARELADQYRNRRSQ